MNKTRRAKEEKKNFIKTFPPKLCDIKKEVIQKYF